MMKKRVHNKNPNKSRLKNLRRAQTNGARVRRRRHELALRAKRRAAPAVAIATTLQSLFLFASSEVRPLPVRQTKGGRSRVQLSV